MEKPSIELTAHQAVLQACQQIADLIGLTCTVPVTLLMRQSPTTMEVITSSQTADTPYRAGDSDSLGHGLYCETVISSQEPLHVPDALADPVWDHNPDIKLGMISYYGVPVSWPCGTPFGTFCILDSRPRRYTPRERALVGSFAAVIETLLSSVVASTALQHAARHDTMTGLLNRHAFLDRLASELERSRRYSHLTAFLFVDVDHFKRINDTYGHTAGDHVLIELAEVLTAQNRESDFVGRLGGEEFAVALPVTDLAGAMEYAERMRATVESRFADAIPCTISVGVAVQLPGEQAVDLLSRADLALYEAKNTGRNRICAAKSAAIKPPSPHQTTPHQTTPSGAEDVRSFG